MLLEYLTLYLSALDFSQFIKVSSFNAGSLNLPVEKSIREIVKTRMCYICHKYIISEFFFTAVVKFYKSDINITISVDITVFV